MIFSTAIVNFSLIKGKAENPIVMVIVAALIRLNYLFNFSEDPQNIEISNLGQIFVCPCEFRFLNNTTAS